jgi:hypothetical protein
MRDKIIKFNEQVITQEELDKKLEEAKKQIGVKIVEITPDNYVQRIQG